MWPQRDPADPDGIAALEHGFTYTWPGHRVLGQLRVPGIVPWTHESPRRYRVLVMLRDATGEMIDVRTRWTGFRRVEITGRRLLVNGVAVRDQRGEPPRRPPRPRAGDHARARVATSNR